MTKPTPCLQLQTLFVTDERHRIVATREPHPSPPPAFIILRGDSACAWAVRADVPEPAALELNRWAAHEPPSEAWERPLLHANRYATLLAGGRIRSGPAFAFPEHLERSGDTFLVGAESELSHPF